MEKHDTDSKNKTWGCGSDHELLFAKFNLKTVGKTMNHPCMTESDL